MIAKVIFCVQLATENTPYTSRHADRVIENAKWIHQRLPFIYAEPFSNIFREA
jgi:hypothetical protein